MEHNTNISIVQLVKVGKLDVHLEISKIRARQDINISVKNYLKKSPDYQTLAEQLRGAEENLRNAPEDEKLFYCERLENIRKVEQDFIVSTLLLAETFSKLDIRTERLGQAFSFFEEGLIKDADKILNEADLLNDQFNLIAFAEYLECRQKYLIHAVAKNNNNFPGA